MSFEGFTSEMSLGTLHVFGVRVRMGLCMRFIFTAIAITLSAGAAQAQDLVYAPVNPSFGGSSFNSAHLLALANAQNDFERPVDDDNEVSDLDRFIRSLESRLLSSLSTQVANAIFGEDAQDNGTIVFGDQTISFVNTLDGIELTITDADGTVTVITIPTLQTDSDDETEDEEEEESEDDGSSSTQDSVSMHSEKILNVEADSLNVVGGLSYQPLRQDVGLLQPIQQPIR